MKWKASDAYQLEECGRREHSFRPDNFERSEAEYPNLFKALLEG